MATIENLGAQLIRFPDNPVQVQKPLPDKVRVKSGESVVIPAAKKTDARPQSGHVEEASHREASSRRGRATERAQQFQRMSLDELAEMLRRINLTFDLFEIQAKFSVDQTTGRVSVEVINQRTGEVIRKIPPYDVGRIIESLERGDSIFTDTMA
ncbi:MAG TPA: flagellar protein FlaG [Firmicutes bacterium]|nr:flagellar protein FlaG [Bacillota bacterium]